MMKMLIQLDEERVVRDRKYKLCWISKVKRCVEINQRIFLIY